MAVKKWRGKWVVDLKVDGRRIRRVSPVQTKAGAKRYEAELLLGWSTGASCSASIDGDRTAQVESPTLAEFAPRWLTTYAVVHNKPSERFRKESVLRTQFVPFFGNHRLDQIGSRELDQFKARCVRRGLLAGTINTYLATLRTLLNTAVEWGELEQVPKIRMMPAPEKDFDWLTFDEARRLLDAARSDGELWFVFFLMALRTGMRKSELRALHWSEVDVERGKVTVKRNAWRRILGTPKNGRIRTIPMTRDLAEALHHWRSLSSGPLVFPGRRGMIMHERTPNEALRRALSAAGLRRIRVHDLRHTFASHLVIRGRTLREVQLLLGHQSIAMTERYAHVGHEQLATAINVLSDT